MITISACIFDLDGVLVDTAKFHYKAWKNLAKNWDINLTSKENEKLKGVGRLDSLKHILNLGSISLSLEEMNHWCTVKNEEYLSYISEIDSQELLPNVASILLELEAKDIKIGLGSANKNAPLIIEKTGIAHFFKAVVSGNDVKNSKPDPEVFIKGAKQLQVKPSETIVFEDSQKGIKAALDGGFYAIGIGDKHELSAAHLVISSFEKHNFSSIIQQLRESINT